MPLVHQPSHGRGLGPPLRSGHPAGARRQWVLSVPKRLRPHLAGDADLAGAVLRILLRVIDGALRESAPPMPRPPPGQAVLVSRTIESLLYGVSPVDPGTYAGALALVLTVSLGAAVVTGLRFDRSNDCERSPSAVVVVSRVRSIVSPDLVRS